MSFACPGRAIPGVLLASLPVLVGISLSAQEPPPPTPAPVESVPESGPERGLYVGPASCAQDACHGATRPRRTYGVAQNEYYVWLNQGPHAGAYAVLFDDRSRGIAANLGFSRPAHEAPGCLSCHAPVPVEERRAGPVEVADGVSCETCHGPASGWRDDHTAEDWSYADVVAAGMTDLRDPETRAALCLGCHLGEEGRTVDHDLIAAGHPELRFELDNFSRTMPPHWLPYEDRRRADRPDRPTHGVRAWAVGQAVSLRRGAEEVARRARGRGDGRWPDFSWMSCTSCHHDLGPASDSVPRETGGAWRARPGLPPWSPARWLVLRVLVERHAPDALPQLDDGVARLADQVSRITTPSAALAATADDLARRLDGVASRLDAVEWSEREVRRTLRALVAARDRLGDADAHSAEQVLQGVYSLAGALVDEDPALLESGLVEAVSALAADLRAEPDRQTWDPERFERMLALVEEEVR